MNNSRTQGRSAIDLTIKVLGVISRCTRLAIFTSLSAALLTTTLTVGLGQGVSTLKLEASLGASIDLSQPMTVSWRYDSNLTLNLTPASDRDRIYLPLAAGTLVSLMAHNGQLNWRSEMGGELSASPTADRQTVYVAAETSNPPSESGTRRATGSLRALGREGGVTQWMRTLAMPLRGIDAKPWQLFAASSDGKIYSFESANGEARWAYDYGAPFNSKPVVSDSRVYIGSEDGTLLALDEATGKLLWRYRTKGAVRGPVANGEILFTSVRATATSML